MFDSLKSFYRSYSPCIFLVVLPTWVIWTFKTPIVLALLLGYGRQLPWWWGAQCWPIPWQIQPLLWSFEIYLCFKRGSFKVLMAFNIGLCGIGAMFGELVLLELLRVIGYRINAWMIWHFDTAASYLHCGRRSSHTPAALTTALLLLISQQSTEYERILLSLNAAQSFLTPLQALIAETLQVLFLRTETRQQFRKVHLPTKRDVLTLFRRFTQEVATMRTLPSAQRRGALYVIAKNFHAFKDIRADPASVSDFLELSHDMELQNISLYNQLLNDELAELKATLKPNAERPSLKRLFIDIRTFLWVNSNALFHRNRFARVDDLPMVPPPSVDRWRKLLESVVQVAYIAKHAGVPKPGQHFQQLVAVGATVQVETREAVKAEDKLFALVLELALLWKEVKMRRR